MAVIIDHPVIDHAGSLHAPIVYILATFPNGKVIQGSGVMVGANNVLTASHVVYSVRNGGAAVSTSVTPAYDGSGNRPYGSYAGGKIHYNQVDDSGGFIRAADVPLDFAVISLKSPLGLKTGFFRLDRNFSTGAANLNSYPATQKGRMIYASANTSLKQFANGVDCLDITDFDVSQGSSGGAVYEMKNGVPYVRGVVSTVKWSAPIADSATVNAYSKVMDYISSDHQDVADSLPVLKVTNQKIPVGKDAVKSYTYQVKGSFPVPVASDVTVSTKSGTALAGVDFEPCHQNVTIPANATAASFNLNVHPNWDAHPGENTLEFTLEFSNPQAAVFADSYKVAKVNISITREEQTPTVRLAANQFSRGRSQASKVAMAN